MPNKPPKDWRAAAAAERRALDRGLQRTSYRMAFGDPFREEEEELQTRIQGAVGQQLVAVGQRLVAVDQQLVAAAQRQELEEIHRNDCQQRASTK